jgi:hypothetical protein
MLSHVGISVLHSLGEVLAHCAIFLPILYLLFRRPIEPYFRAPRGVSSRS